MKHYLDASVLVALLTSDALSRRADHLVRTADGPLIVSDWAQAEFASAVSRRARTGAISDTVAQAAFFGLDKWMTLSADRVETTGDDMTLCAILVRRLDLGLRTPDALHLALAQRHQCALASFDNRMTEAAHKLAMGVWAGAPN